jgi:hypothetical protein
MDRAHPLGKSVMHAAIPPSQDEAPAVATIAPSFSYPSLIMRRSQMAETRFVRHGIPCGCCGAELRSGFNRRRFMQIAGAGLAITLPSFFVVAAEGNYEAMVLTCIDPRIQEPVWKYLAERDLTGKYSQFVIAGAAIGVVAPAFKDWHKAFWDNSVRRFNCTVSRK